MLTQTLSSNVFTYLQFPGWAGFHQYEDRTRDSSLFCQVLCSSRLVLDSMVHWLGSKKGSVRVRLCATFAFLRLPGHWILVTQHYSCSSSCSLELQCSPAEPGWQLCLSVPAHSDRNHSLWCHTSFSLCIDFSPFMRAQNWSDQGSSRAEPQLCPAELLAVTQLAQIPPAQTLGCYCSSSAVHCILPRESPAQCSSCMLGTDVQQWVSMGYTNWSPALLINRNA